MDDMKPMKKIMDALTSNWPLLSPAGRTYIKSSVEALDIDVPVLSDEDKERT